MPVIHNGQREVRFIGQGHYDRLLAGSTVQLALVAVEGIEPPTRGL